MRAILKGKWFILAAWVLIITVLMMIAPNMEGLVRDKGQITVPAGYSSTQAVAIIKEMQSSRNKGNELDTVLIFHSWKKLTNADFSSAKQAVNNLLDNKDKLGITSITNYYTDEKLKDQLLSKDGQTLLVPLKVKANGRDAKQISADLYSAVSGTKLAHYYTGSWMIDEDLITNSQDGLKKTEGITVVFILLVLLLVFRSLVAPLIPLITVGFSYLAAQSVVALLVGRLNFPLSNFTQTFLVAVLFGIGTDYCILLLSRFKEEMSLTDSVTEAIIKTYRTAGKTVLFSGVAVLIGFASIGMSTFKLYQSASAVAVGVAILLLALVTVVPFFMAVLGKKLFWPTRRNLEHNESKIWGFAGSFALARPLMAIIIVAIVSVPFLLTYKGQLSFNSLEEIGNNYDSIKGFNIIAKSFGPGESMPTQVVIKNDVKMDTSDYISLAEKISGELKKVDDVKTVRSVTRPAGSPIDDLYVSAQAKTLGNGLGQGNDGIVKISNGLKEAGAQLSANQPKMQDATSGISKLIDGTNQLKTGMGSIQDNLAKIETGLKQSSMGTTQAKQGLEQIREKSAQVLSGSQALLDGYKQADSGLSTLLSNYTQVANGLDSLHQSLTATDQYFANLETEDPAIQQNQNYQAIKMTVKGAQNATATMAGSLKQLNAGLKGAQEGIVSADSHFADLIAGQLALINGMDGVISGIGKLEGGLDQLDNGQSQIIQNLPKMTDGLNGLNDGQQQLLSGFQSLGGQIGQLTDGLSKSASGLNDVSSGLHSAQDYLDGISKVKQNGFYVPQNVLDSKDFAQVLDTYMSSDRKIMTMDVIFKENPYSNQAISRVPEIKNAVKRAVKGTKLEDAQVAVGGVTSTYSDLDSISKGDYSRTVVLMLAGIGIILIILLRSLIMPLYLIGSLILTYYTSMAISERIFVDGLGYTGISWAVPFFAFVILVALGIDYSIFLMDRFNEYKHLPVEKAILLSMKKMGTVIISAAIILGGTFAAMMPSGVLSLLEIATILLIGLALYALIVLPLLIPVMVKTFGNANWWPFQKEKKESAPGDQSVHM